MKCIFCSVLFAISLSGQSAGHNEFKPVGWVKLQSSTPEQALDSTLSALTERVASPGRLSQELAQVMMRLADNDRRPPWPVVVSFTDKLTNELIGRQLSSAQTTTIRDCMIDVMRRAGTGTAGVASRLQQTLAAIGIDSTKARLVVRDFIAVGEAVRGPDDSPVVR